MWFQLAGGSLIFVVVLVILTLPSLRRWRVGRAYPWFIVFQLAIVATLWLGAAVSARVEPQVLISLLALVMTLLAIITGIIAMVLSIVSPTPRRP